MTEHPNYGYWVKHPAHNPKGTHNTIPLTEADKRDGWTEVVLVAQQPATHVQNPAEIEHVADVVSKNGAESNMAQQPAPSAAAALPEGWVPLVITHEGQYPEEVAYGPQILMDRLGKWLRKYFDHVVASKAQPSPTPQADSTPVAICNACGAELLEVKQSPNSYLSAEQFDADKLGDWYCKCCPKGPSEGSSTHRYFWNRDLGASAPQADSQPIKTELFNPLEGGNAETALQMAAVIALRDSQPAAALEITTPNDSGSAQCIVRWQIETPRGWVGAWNREALEWLLGRAPADSVTAPAGVTVAVGSQEFDLADTGARFTTADMATACGQAFREGQAAATPPAQAADSVLEDAARWRAMRELNWIDSAIAETHGISEGSPETLDAAVDAIRKQGANHD